MINYDENDARVGAEIKELQPSPGEGVSGGGTTNPLVTETVDKGQGTPVEENVLPKEAFKTVQEIYNFLNGIKIKGKSLEDYIDSEGGVTQEELDAALAPINTALGERVVLKNFTTKSITSLTDADINTLGYGHFVLLSNFVGFVIISNASAKYLMGSYNSDKKVIFVKYYRDTPADSWSNSTSEYDLSDIDKKANLSGANFTGAITSPSIIENMTGYSFVKAVDTAQIKYTNIYAGISKTGNKLSFVLFLKIRKIDTVTQRALLGEFVVPSDILPKLIPTELFSEQMLIGETLRIVDESTLTSADVLFIVPKTETGFRIMLGQGSVNNLNANNDYIIRVERTFLLSENLMDA